MAYHDQQLIFETKAAVKHFAQDVDWGGTLDLEANPPYRTPLDVWSREKGWVGDMANDVLNEPVAHNFTDGDIRLLTVEMRDTQHLPLPTMKPGGQAFSHLLDAVDGLSALSGLRRRESKKTDASSTRRSDSRIVEHLVQSSSTLQEYFCGPDAGLSTKLYYRYIRTANNVSKARWETSVDIIDLHRASEQILEDIQLSNRHHISRKNLEFFKYFRRQVAVLDELVLMEFQNFDTNSGGKRSLMTQATSIFAHITALKQGYENGSSPPTWSSVADQKGMSHQSTKRPQKSIQFAESVTFIGVAAFEDESESEKDDGPSSVPEEEPANHDQQDMERQMDNEVSLFDTRSCNPDGESARVAKLWFKSFRERTQTLLKARRKATDQRVRIAVLDTGIDLEHPTIAKAKADTRIVRCQSWVDGDQSTTDKCGHGTHIASIILRMAPWADLYVAKVFKNGDEVNKAGATAVANAINHARSEWKVDIISISFGYRLYVDEIETAINDCVKSKPPILIFAAAANTGAREDLPAFPANMGSVFCINSASGDGVRSPYNPPIQHGDDNFSFLGEGISGAWPLALDPVGENVNSVSASKVPEKVLSGTSFATPVAASVAALILEFCRQQPPLLNALCVARVRTYEGMREVLRKTMVSKEDRGDTLIQPWTLLDARKRDDLEEARRVAATTLATAIKSRFGV